MECFLRVKKLKDLLKSHGFTKRLIEDMVESLARSFPTFIAEEVSACLELCNRTNRANHVVHGEFFFNRMWPTWTSMPTVYRFIAGMSISENASLAFEIHFNSFCIKKNDSSQRSRNARCLPYTSDTNHLLCVGFA